MRASTATFAFVIAAAWAAACGGGQDTGAGGGTVGDTHDDDSTGDLDVPDGLASGDGGVAAADDAGAAEEAAPVTFRLMNEGSDDLVFSMDRGWQPVIFAWYGEKPNAVPILMFPKFCTAACDADEVCPSCPQPERTKDIKAAEKRETVAPGAHLDVPWDAQMFVYEKGPKRGCECHATEPAPEEEYTVKACGFRITTTHKQASKYQCVEGSMALPGDGPQIVELVFPDPAKPEK